MSRKQRIEAKWYHGLITFLLLICTMLFVVVGYGGTPLLPLIVGCIVACVVCTVIGFRWEEILGFMIDGIIPSLEAILILLLIGSLVGVWILSGTVPALIYYGLYILNARFFFAASALICAIVSFAIGAWGTVGTVGIALVGIGTALQLPLPMVVGSVISGSYFGDAVSPLSDATNLTSAVVGEGVFDVVKERIVPIVSSFVLGLVFYLILGWVNSAADSGQIAAAVEPMKETLRGTYRISPLCILPLVVVIAGIVLKLPAIPAILIGVIVGAVIAVFGQGASMDCLLYAMTDGNVSETGVELLDTLFTAGGISSMMSTVSLILAAMSFGGLMQKSGQIRALVEPLAKRLKIFGLLSGITALSCLIMNILLPDQYLGISVPGQMFQDEFDRRGYSRVSLSTALTAAPLTSPLVPWNTCGIYCLALLGVSAKAYFPYAFFNLIGLIVVLFLGFFTAKKVGSSGETRRESSEPGLECK